MTPPQKLESLACGAKTRALENAVWKQDKCKHQTSPAEQGMKKRAPSTKVSKTPHKQSLVQKPLTLKHQCIESESEASEHDSFSEGDKKVSHYRCPTKLHRTFAMQDVNVMLPISENEQSDVGSDDAQCNVHDAGADSDSDADAAGLGNDSEDDDLDAAVRMLSDETLTWGDVNDTISESTESTTTGGELSISSDLNKDTAKLVQTPAKKSVASLVQTKKGKVKLLNQNLQTHQVIQATISEAKCHVMFVHGYPELVKKNQLSM
ncbi:uncharacterized protein BJ212DRAFT_1479030 [Suillus subaureus]|uniref:Uncharacterized protein n=1 Tax=Suillus subaureus TaxID=48587 RepID=A0A9P7JFU1_9AGAM|nr:uncharacterized protein BJ212DRAFT_1479030 [Suillus subaureus]KAG1819805.1 hypothetical protein BJ212DRAFT_1479030 [Suillus subaureus]